MLAHTPPSPTRQAARCAATVLATLLALAGCGHEAEPATVRPEPAASTSTATSESPPTEATTTPTTSTTSAVTPTANDPEVDPEVAAAAGAVLAGDSAADRAVAVPTPPTPTQSEPQVSPPALHDAIRQVVRMPSNRELARAARSHRMRIQNLSWEDTGRYMGSSVGPNISDLTLEVLERIPGRHGRTRQRTYLLPVLRYPNFTDRTADVPSDRFWVRVGNQAAGAQANDLTPVPLTEVLSHLRTYLSDPNSLRGENDDFTAPRDSHYLVSAQHVFVPVPDGVRVEWAPVLFNYQSNPGSPAVLCLVITREGTSITIIENRPDPLHPDGWGQRLYFNHAGQRTLFTAERRSDVAERIEAGQARAEDATALEEGADMVMIVQVPLRVPMPPRRAAGGAPMPASSAMGELADGSGGGAGYGSGRGTSDVERAVVGHGLEEGPFAEARNRRIRRDPRFPIRVTVQFYRATSNGIVSEADLTSAVETIERVYSEADYVGSLVVGSQERPTSWVRPTDPQGAAPTP